ncbi:hypothetical protein LPJ71_003047, partial [Coemansia sp. S17]
MSTDSCTVPSIYRATDDANENDLKLHFPEMEYICGQPPRRPADATFYYVREEHRVQRALLSTLTRETWL